MSWRVAYREKDKKYRLWSTISDAWLTRWITKKAMQQYIAEDMFLEYKKKVIAMYLKFPHDWPFQDSEGCIRYMRDEAGYQAYGAWLKTLSNATAETYVELVENKYNEVMKELG